MNLNIIDTHAHLDMAPFDPDRNEVIARAQSAGVSRIITIGIDLESSRKAIELAEKYPLVLATVGVHPQESEGVKKGDLDELAKLARRPKVVAIGEIGLDYFHNQSSKEAQLRVLQYELDLAQKIDLPVVVHCRQAQAEMINILQSWTSTYKLPEGKQRGVIHCFSGDIDNAEKYMDMGFVVSVGAYIGYPSSLQLRETLKSIPGDRLVIETDCPFLPPQKFRGKRNEPSYTLITLGVLAEIKRVTLEEMAHQTTLNATRVFNIEQ